MARNRVEGRAQAIFDFLQENLNVPFTIDQLMAETGLQDSATTRAAIRRARGIAEDAGLCFPVACHANGNTYCVTDDPSAVLDPAIHLGAIAQGVGTRKDVHDSFMQKRMAQMSPADRQIFNHLESLDAAARQQREAHRSLLKTLMAVRKETKEAAS